MGGCGWRWREELLVLLPVRAIWREASRDLLVADLHLGKAEVFQAFGIPLPSDEDRGTLSRLAQVCSSCKPERVIILGDLIHGRQGLTARLLHDLATLPEQLGAQILLVGGNHDRDLRLPVLPRNPSFRLGSLWLSHEPERGPDSANLLNLCGHIHPATTLRQGADRLRLPCFAYDELEQRMLIPAFGELTGGHDCGHRYRKWLVAEGAIVPWLTPEPQKGKRRHAR
jgi:DNA ligase-associated metallophosphoesterase